MARIPSFSLERHGWGGGGVQWRRRKKMTQRKGNKEKEAEEENIKVLSFTSGRPWPTSLMTLYKSYHLVGLPTPLSLSSRQPTWKSKRPRHVVCSGASVCVCVCVCVRLYVVSVLDRSRMQYVNEMVITAMFIKLSREDINSLMNMHVNLLIKLIILLKMHSSSKDIFPMIFTCSSH